MTPHDAEPVRPWPCGSLSREMPGEICGLYEGHEGGHGAWIFSRPGLTAGPPSSP